MSHSSGGVIHLEDSDADVEEVGSDVEEVVTWDQELRLTKTFSTAFLILSGCRFDSPNLDEQQKILFNFLAEKVADMSATCRPDSQMSSLLAKMPPSRRHNFDPDTFFLSGFADIHQCTKVRT